jgi:hypothetical protein
MPFIVRRTDTGYYYKKPRKYCPRRYWSNHSHYTKNKQEATIFKSRSGIKNCPQFRHYVKDRKDKWVYIGPSTNIEVIEVRLV